jgi:DNA modification methylase
MPSALADLCIRAGCPVGGTVIDPFTGSGTTGIVALRQDKRFVGCELNAEYAKMAARRIAAVEIQLALL